MRTRHEVSGAGVELGIRLVFEALYVCLLSLAYQARSAQSLWLVLAAASPHGMPYDCPHMLLCLPVHTSKPLLRCSLAFYDDR